MPDKRATDLLDMIRRQPNSDDFIHLWNGQWCVTTGWLVGICAGVGFLGETAEDAAAQLVDFIDNSKGYRSLFGRIVEKSGWPDLKKVEAYLEDHWRMETDNA